MWDTGFWREVLGIWDIKVRMMDLSEEDANEFNQLKLILQEIQPCSDIEDEFIWLKHCNEF